MPFTLIDSRYGPELDIREPMDNISRAVITLEDGHELTLNYRGATVYGQPAASPVIETLPPELREPYLQYSDQLIDNSRQLYARMANITQDIAAIIRDEPDDPSEEMVLQYQKMERQSHKIYAEIIAKQLNKKPFVIRTALGRPLQVVMPAAARDNIVTLAPVAAIDINN